MQFKSQDTLNESLSLNPELQNDDQQLSDLPPQQQEQQQPNPEDQNHNQIQQINDVLQHTISNINEFQDGEDQNMLSVNLFDNSYQQEVQGIQKNQFVKKKQQQPRKQKQPRKQSGHHPYDEENYSHYKSIQQYFPKKLTHQQIIRILMKGNIQAYQWNEENGLIPVLCLYDLDQLIRIEINKSIIYRADNNHIYYKNRKMLQKQVTLNQKYENQSEGE